MGMTGPGAREGLTLTTVGNRWQTAERVLDLDEMVAFAKLWDPLPVHTDPLSAAAGRFGGVIASGLYTLAVYQSLVSMTVLRDQPVVAARALERVGFARPAFPGDVVHAEAEVAAVAPGADGTVEVGLTGSLIREGKQLLEVRVALVVAASTSSRRGRVSG